MSATVSRLWRLVGIGACASLAPIIGLTLFTSSGHDDSHITYWSGYALAEFGEMVNYNGDRVEQSSSLLHVLLTALVVKASPVSAATAGFSVGLFGASTTTVLAYLTSRRLNPRSAWLAPILVGSVPFLTYWAVGGLETTLAAAALLGSVLTSAIYLEGGGGRHHRALLAASSCIGSFVLARPESALLFVLAMSVFAAVWALLGRAGRLGSDLVGPPVRRALTMTAITFGLYSAVSLWRWSYFGELVPNPVSSKVAGLELSRGLRYVLGAFDRPEIVVLFGLGLCGLLTLWRRPTVLGILLATATAAQFVFVVSAGGDWMGGGRLLVPALPLLALLAAQAVATIPRPSLVKPAAFGVIAVQIAGLFLFARQESLGKPIWATIEWTERPDAEAARSAWFERNKRVHLRDAALVSPLIRVVDDLRPFVDGPIFMTSGQAGLIAYHAAVERFGEVRFVDRHNLVTDEFEGCSDVRRTSSFGLSIEYRYWFANADACGVRVPDIVFDLNSFSDRTELRGRFTSVFETTGEVETGSSILPGAPLDAREFIAVRNDLLRHVDVGALG